MNKNMKELYGKSLNKKYIKKIEEYYFELNAEQKKIFDDLISYFNKKSGNKKYLITNLSVKIMIDSLDRFNIYIFPIIERLTNREVNSNTEDCARFCMHRLEGEIIDYGSFMSHAGTRFVELFYFVKATRYFNLEKWEELYYLHEDTSLPFKDRYIDSSIHVKTDFSKLRR